MYGQKENISLPSGLANQLKHLYGPDARIVARAPVGGGDINEAYHLVLQDGRDLFPEITNQKIFTPASGLEIEPVRMDMSLSLKNQGFPSLADRE